MSSLSELEKMKVPDLKAALKLKGLNTVGNKKQLIERLIDSSSNNKTEDEDDEVNEDYVLGGEGDESIEDDQISEQSDRLLINDVFMSPASKTSLVSNNNSSTPEKENNAISAAKTTVVEKVTAVTAAIEVGDEAETNKAAAAVAASPAAVKALTEQERRDLRMKRFDPTASSDQKLARAQRFGLAEKGVGTLTDSKVSNTDVNSLDKLKQRANRFGVTSSTSLIKTEDKDRILKRKARFGIGINLGQMADEEVKQPRRSLITFN